MKHDRELIQLARTKRLDAIVDRMQRTPAAIIRRAAILGLSIKRSAKGR